VTIEVKHGVLRQQWKFSAGDGLYTSPAFLNDTVYIAAPQRCSPTYTRLLTPARRILVSFVALAALSASADEQRVYHVDAYGDVPYGKPSYKVSGDGRVVGDLLAIRLHQSG
jgi:hypothetical protein